MTARTAITPEQDDTVYPESPETPMPQSEWHRILIGLLIDALTHFYRDDDQVCVSGDIFVYWRRGDPSAVVSPDVFVAPGAGRRRRETYRAWLEGGRLPEFVIEILSGTTGDDDLERKLKLYRDTLKVKEYFVFDPRIRRPDPRLVGYRLVRRRYVPIGAVAGRLPSLVTGLHLETHGEELRLWDPAAGAWLPTGPEREAASEAARLAALERIRELEAELARRRGPSAP